MVQELEEFAMKTVGKNAFVQIALGSGQTEGALIALRRCAEEGHWLCLKNLHLVTHWLGEFEKFFRALKPKPKFRLWLTTEPHPTFPSILLQQSLKVTYVQAALALTCLFLCVGLGCLRF
jgi:dynein heavy chain 2